MLYNQIELVFYWRLGTRARPSSLVGSRTRARSLSLVGSIIFQNLGEPNQRWPPSPPVYQWPVSYHTSKTSEPWRCRDSREPSWDHSVISGRFTLVGGLRRVGRSAARGIYSGGRSAARWAVSGASKEIAERRSTNGKATFRTRCEEYAKTKQLHKRSARQDVEDDDCCKTLRPSE